MMLVEWEETITESSHIIYLYICIASNVFLKPRLIARLFVLSSEEKRGSEFSAKLNLTMKEKQEEQKLVCADKKVIERVLGPRVSQPRQILSPCISLYFPGEFRNMEQKTPVYLSPTPATYIQ